MGELYFISDEGGSDQDQTYYSTMEKQAEDVRKLSGSWGEYNV